MPGKTVREVLREHTRCLLAIRGIVGVGEGERDGNPCIRVFAIKKTPELVKQIPSSIGGYTVEVQETGEIRALDPS